MSDKKTKILMIDDDEQSCLALCAAARSQGWDFVCAKDASAGRKLFRTERPDLVFVEYRLPGMNEGEGIKMIRELDACVPIICLTTEETQEAANRAFEAGAGDFALKPIKAPDMCSRIRLHMDLLECGKLLNNRAEIREHGPKAKGISPVTQELIRGAFRTNAENITVETIAERTGLAYQTTYRYLQHMAAQDLVEVCQNYGKVGRPKQKYRLK